MVVTPHPEIDDFPRLTGQEALWPYLLASALLFVLGLWFFASRLRSNIARWIMSLFALGTLNTVATQLFMHQPAKMAMPMAIRFLAMSGAVLGVCAVWFLHTPQSRAWFTYGR